MCRKIPESWRSWWFGFWFKFMDFIINIYYALFKYHSFGTVESLGNFNSLNNFPRNPTKNKISSWSIRFSEWIVVKKIYWKKWNKRNLIWIHFIKSVNKIRRFIRETALDIGFEVHKIFINLYCLFNINLIKTFNLKDQEKLF